MVWQSARGRTSTAKSKSKYLAWKKSIIQGIDWKRCVSDVLKNTSDPHRNWLIRCATPDEKYLRKDFPAIQPRLALPMSVICSDDLHVSVCKRETSGEEAKAEGCDENSRSI